MFQKFDNFNGLPKCKCSNAAFDVTIDQFDAQEFNQNEAGWIRNTISELQRAQSKSEYDAIMARLIEIKSEGGIPEGTSVQDAISQIKPRWAQSPNEIEQFISMTNGDVMKKLDEAYQKAIKDGKIKDGDAVVETSPSPSPSKSAES